MIGIPASTSCAPRSTSSCGPDQPSATTAAPGIDADPNAMLRNWTGVHVNSHDAASAATPTLAIVAPNTPATCKPCAASCNDSDGMCSRKFRCSAPWIGGACGVICGI
ncbi:hypothetical protein [Nocardia sp. NPDC046763]|uniref:hypothetical protein n=1 Tax=Nocardia sp. NPDC046763 TaxID=3155256 RepID=UPI0034085DCE